jgi:signal transduction histidine kinase
VLTVADQGIGIPEADRDRIFEAFERGSNVGNVKGTGLGLNIVRRMTELLGGRISVESELARGSCFTVEFPAAKAENP